MRIPFLSPPPPPHVAPLVSAEHAPDLAALHATGFARPWEVHEFEQMLCERGHVAHGLMQGGRLSGFALSRIVLDEAEILTVVIGPASRGAGLGRTLLAAHLRALADAGVRVVHLEVDDGNAAALALYRRLGFVETGRRAAYYTRPDGSRAAAVTMRASLA
ncbi:ribosomal-protein-alanine acetyltransferase [Methylobacterium sp. 4-46]|uniref:ribosomal protein S18-alanine N-acetyltransferase n=1 Tax=unclassified Methylobacterium TaxID=2615210 RepID=UPI000152E882|nr:MULTISPECIES: ribosomal protein S18-alanine N-acetyltransferase [Methylobacterium]ACA17782.1 ribosomal-protein-alanine acetyltransferase [Methylobacterium sp. 4-46]WFT83450.1 ribosomal protein S18-alanine N-acetyltransferase [Methylobacterium nodulans]